MTSFFARLFGASKTSEDGVEDAASTSTDSPVDTAPAYLNKRFEGVEKWWNAAFPANRIGNKQVTVRRGYARGSAALVLYGVNVIALSEWEERAAPTMPEYISDVTFHMFASPELMSCIEFDIDLAIEPPIFDVHRLRLKRTIRDSMWLPSSTRLEQDTVNMLRGQEISPVQANLHTLIQARTNKTSDCPMSGNSLHLAALVSRISSEDGDQAPATLRMSCYQSHPTTPIHQVRIHLQIQNLRVVTLNRLREWVRLKSTHLEEVDIDLGSKQLLFTLYPVELISPYQWDSDLVIERETKRRRANHSFALGGAGGARMFAQSDNGNHHTTVSPAMQFSGYDALLPTTHPSINGSIPNGTHSSSPSQTGTTSSTTTASASSSSNNDGPKQQQQQQQQQTNDESKNAVTTVGSNRGPPFPKRQGVATTTATAMNTLRRIVSTNGAPAPKGALACFSTRLTQSGGIQHQAIRTSVLGKRPGGSFASQLR